MPGLVNSGPRPPRASARSGGHEVDPGRLGGHGCGGQDCVLGQDLERRRYPLYEHVAVIVAEDNKHYIGLVRDATVDLPGDLTHRPLKWLVDRLPGSHPLCRPPRLGPS